MSINLLNLKKSLSQRPIHKYSTPRQNFLQISRPFHWPRGVRPKHFPQTNPFCLARLRAPSGLESSGQIQWAAVAAAHEMASKKSKCFVLERETGFAPATSTLARWHSTAELLPRADREITKYIFNLPLHCCQIL